MIPLATLEQFAAFRGAEPDGTDAKALQHLQGASSVFRALARQTISLVEDDTVELELAPGRYLALPERPVIEVKDVLIRHRDGTEEAVADSALVVNRRGQLTRTLGGAWCHRHGSWAELTYTHGYDPIPDEVVEVVCAMAARAMSNPRGVVSRTIVNYSETFAQGPQAAGLTGWEAKVVRRYWPLEP